MSSELEEDEVIAPKSPSPETKRQKAEVMKVTEDDLRRIREAQIAKARV